MKLKIIRRPTSPTNQRSLTPARIAVASRPLRVLDLDCEARPLHWIAQDYVSKEITAIAWAWADAPQAVTCYLLGDVSQVEMLSAFLTAYNEADLVTGHYIRGYDLPTINAALTECQLPSLSDKLAHDTKIDLIRRSGLSSSQENLGAMLGLSHPKIQMDQTKWRAANRLTEEGKALTRKRVVGDVQQHIELRQRLIDLGYLGPPKKWKSNSTLPAVPYTP